MTRLSLTLSILLLTTLAWAQPSANTIYHSGAIVTMEGDAPQYVEAVAVKQGRILFAGAMQDALKFRTSSTELVDLKGQAMLPGFIDAHSHLTQMGTALRAADLAAPPYGKTDSFDTLRMTLEEYVKEKNPPEGTWILGIGYDTSILPGHPDRHLLDKVSQKNPILIIHSSGHIGVANSMALSIAKIDADTPDPSGGVIVREKSGDPSGVLEETAMWKVLLEVPQPTEKELLDDLGKALDLYASLGLTTVQDGRTTPNDLELLEKASEQGRLYLDVVAYPAIEAIGETWQPDFAGYKNYVDRLRIGGVKLSLDGSMPGKTAFLTEPYFKAPIGKSDDYRGFPAFPDETVDRLVKKAWDNDWQLLSHCNADAAGDQLLAAVEKVGVPKDKDWRPVMIHAQAAREDQLDKMKELGMLVSFEMTHPFLFGDYYVESVFGPERAARNNPAGSAKDRGMTFTFHTDAPVVKPDVMLTVWSGVTRLSRSGKVIGPEQRVPVFDAFQAITIHGAYQNFEEDSKGTITEEKLADFVVLSEDPFKVDPVKLHDVKVTMTIKEDRVVYPAQDQ